MKMRGESYEYKYNIVDPQHCQPDLLDYFSDDPCCVATGNWGCGAFGGDPQLKSLIQLMAAAENGRDTLYLTFGDEKLRDDLTDIYNLLVSKNVSVGSLYNVGTIFY